MTQKLKVLDLFSGIGGFSLGLERSGGFETVAFCEIEPFPRKVLERHWPNVPCYQDVRSLTAEQLARDGITIDVICGGFPCQDISTAGKGAGLEGERSGLWSEFLRLITETRPRYAIIENVSALRSRGLDVVLRGLSEVGYDGEWHCIPAAAVGAPHRRDRVWIVAYPNRTFSERTRLPGGVQTEFSGSWIGGADPTLVADRTSHGRVEGISDGAGCDERTRPREELGFGGVCETMAYANSGRVHQHGSHKNGHQSRERQNGSHEYDGATGGRAEIVAEDRFKRHVATLVSQWAVEPDVGRVANGVPRRVDRLKGLGNAVVPQIPELIGRAIMEREQKERDQ